MISDALIKNVTTKQLSKVFEANFHCITTGRLPIGYPE